MIAAERLRYIDFGKQIASQIRGTLPDSLYVDCSGHFNVKGNHLLADIAFEYLMNDAEIRTVMFGTDSGSHSLFRD